MCILCKNCNYAFLGIHKFSIRYLHQIFKYTQITQMHWTYARLMQGSSVNHKCGNVGAPQSSSSRAASLADVAENTEIRSPRTGKYCKLPANAYLDGTKLRTQNKAHADWIEQTRQRSGTASVDCPLYEMRFLLDVIKELVRNGYILSNLIWMCRRHV